MKVNLQQSDATFRPFDLTLRVESVEEARALYRLLSYRSISVPAGITQAQRTDLENALKTGVQDARTLEENFVNFVDDVRATMQ